MSFLLFHLVKLNQFTLNILHRYDPVDMSGLVGHLL